MNEKSCSGHGNETENAALGADGAAGEPFCAVKRGIREMTLENVAAIGYREEIGFAKIECRMPAYDEPEIAGTLER